MHRNPFNDSSLASIGIHAALLAGNLLRNGFGTSFAIHAKTHALNLVTEFDMASEKTIIAYIKKYFPGHTFLAEESGLSENSKASVQWIIDPLDGTMNFARNVPLFTVSIAALVDGRDHFGVIYQPLTDELFVALKDRGSYLNGTKLKVSEVSQMDKAICATGFPYDLNETKANCINQFTKIMEFGNPIRIMGCATLNLAYIAAGRFDAYWGSKLLPWDIAAGKLIVEEAGGRITHYDGSDYSIFDQLNVVATNSKLHPILLNLLKT